MRDTLRWAYALNQWNVRLDVFVRHEDQQRALKTVSACGFDTIELASGTGRWDNISRPEVILLNHGSPDGFLAFLRRAKVQGVSSMFWDPAMPTEELQEALVRTVVEEDDLGAADVVPATGARRQLDRVEAAGRDRLERALLVLVPDEDVEPDVPLVQGVRPAQAVPHRAVSSSARASASACASTLSMYHLATAVASA